MRREQAQRDEITKIKNKEKINQMKTENIIAREADKTTTAIQFQQLQFNAKQQEIISQQQNQQMQQQLSEEQRRTGEAISKADIAKNAADTAAALAAAKPTVVYGGGYYGRGHCVHGHWYENCPYGCMEQMDKFLLESRLRDECLNMESEAQQKALEAKFKEDILQVAPSGDLRAQVVSLQKFDGSWEISAILSFSCLTESAVYQANPLVAVVGASSSIEGTEVVWATAIAIVFLEVKCSGTKSSWGMVAKKGRNFIKRALLKAGVVKALLIEKVNELIKKAEELLKPVGM